MSEHKTCKTEIISESSACTITRCKSCNTYHLHIGPMSLRLKEEVFNDLSNTILNAQWMILQDNEQNLSPSLAH